MAFSRPDYIAAAMWFELVGTVGQGLWPWILFLPYTTFLDHLTIAFEPLTKQTDFIPEGRSFSRIPQ